MQGIWGQATTESWFKLHDGTSLLGNSRVWLPKWLPRVGCVCPPALPQTLPLPTYLNIEENSPETFGRAKCLNNTHVSATNVQTGSQNKQEFRFLLYEIATDKPNSPVAFWNVCNLRHLPRVTLNWRKRTHTLFRKSGFCIMPWTVKAGPELTLLYLQKSLMWTRWPAASRI